MSAGFPVCWHLQPCHPTTASRHPGIPSSSTSRWLLGKGKDSGPSDTGPAMTNASGRWPRLFSRISNSAASGSFQSRTVRRTYGRKPNERRKLSPCNRSVVLPIYPVAQLRPTGLCDQVWQEFPCLGASMQHRSVGEVFGRLQHPDDVTQAEPYLHAGGRRAMVSATASLAGASRRSCRCPANRSGAASRCGLSGPGASSAEARSMRRPSPAPSRASPGAGSPRFRRPSAPRGPPPPAQRPECGHAQHAQESRQASQGRMFPIRGLNDCQGNFGPNKGLPGNECVT